MFDNCYTVRCYYCWRLVFITAVCYLVPKGMIFGSSITVYLFILFHMRIVMLIYLLTIGYFVLKRYWILFWDLFVMIGKHNTWSKGKRKKWAQWRRSQWRRQILTREGGWIIHDCERVSFHFYLFSYRVDLRECILLAILDLYWI